MVHFSKFLAAFVFSRVASVLGQTDFSNPVMWQDLADVDISRVGDAFYYSASTMHYSPGAPILRSYDLVNWEYIGHSVPSLDFGDDAAYNLDGARAYIRGIWASFLKYRPSTSTWIWGGCIDFSKTYIYTAPAPEGPWVQASVIDNCYYDAGLLVDDDGTLYVSSGSTNISISQLSADGLSQVSTQIVYNSTEGYIEGSRPYKVNGNYYILVTHPATAELVLKSTSGSILGPYEIRALVSGVDGPVTFGGNPHQGGIVDTPNGDWYYMAFVDAYPGGRIPVLAPVVWDEDGWPSVTLVNGAWNASYAYPLSEHPAKSPTGTDTFSGTSLAAEWEWNHNPDNSKWSLNSGLVLQTATVTDDFYAARNTLTHRTLGPSSVGTIQLDYSTMIDGDHAGLAIMRHQSASIGVKNVGGSFSVVAVNNMTLNSDWTTASTGTEVDSADISGGQVWLRVAANIAPDSDHMASFSYSTDGETFTSFGESFLMDADWRFFMGYRYGIFNFATAALGGAVTVKAFNLAQQ